ncbi:alpha/beta hydrolase [Rhodococcus sp. HNM0569]|uniref:alpha/beta hydrolase n=1 Tax=Rhodococcus sp. HNM0569 TaxID=2716340 RepID=UPI00146CAC2E|nr:alpha/beta hydrolase [Rhodococcus sp. HNM0569]NLU82570.1 alpha/beta hydrolase [Rhodococcus sp. HNM0569]
MPDTEITFDSGAVTHYGSLRLPDASGPVPAALILAGSGPTDRNGDSALLDGDIGTLRFLADVLEQHGYASLRYDKLGSGLTGLGPYDVDDIAELGFTAAFVEPASDALDLLAARPEVDATRVLVIGHSDGGLTALDLAVSERGDRVRGVGLLEPLAVRLLDLLTNQIDAQLSAVTAAGQLPTEVADELRVALAGTVESLRTDGTIPDGLPEPLQNAGLVAANAKALAEEDALDPRALAQRLPGGMPVVTSCSAKDIQVSVADVAALDDALAHTALTSIRMQSANHVLKDLGDAASTGSDYTLALPYSAEFAEPFGAWLDAAR